MRLKIKVRLFKVVDRQKEIIKGVVKEGLKLKQFSSSAREREN